MAGIFQTPELALGIAVGGAAGAAFEPKLEVPKQSAWLANPARLPDVGLIAALIAGGKVTPTDGLNMSRRLGYDKGPLDALTWLAQDRLDFAVMLRLWRRFGAFSAGDKAALDALVDETLAHEQLDWNYQPWLKRMYSAELPGIGDIAYGVVRGILPAPSWVPVAPPTTTSNVKRFPQVEIDPVQLAEALGYDEEMLKLMVGRSGLSMAPGMAAQGFFRGILAEDDYLLAIAEGDLRTEWGHAVREVSRFIPTTGNFVEHHLRGWSTAQEMYDGTARHGMTQADTDVVFQTTRRPLTVPTITKALARGGTFNPSASEIQDPYSASVHQANLGPEWYDLGEHMKYSYPSAFVLRQLLKDGAITQTEAADIFKYEGYPPALADKIAAAYAPTGAAKGDPHVTKAQNTLYTTTHKSYIADEIPDATATTSLEAAGVPVAVVPAVLGVWQAERDLIRKSLSAAQVKKAWSEGVTNPATNVPWTEADATARLLELGYSPDDAATFLAL